MEKKQRHSTLLNDIHWLSTQYIDNRFSSYKIAKLVGTSSSVVLRYLRKHNIPIRSRSNARVVDITTISEAELNDQYLIANKTIEQVAKHFGVHHRTITKYIQKYNLYKLKHQQFDNTLDDLNWLSDEYVTNNKSSIEIASDLGTNKTTVLRYLKKYSISRPKKLIHVDRNLLHQLHVDDKMTAEQIGIRFGCSPTCVLRKMNELDIKIRHNYHRSSGEQEISDFLTCKSVDFTTNDREIISPLELDFYLPEYKLAIEYCGLYWHSTRHPRINSKYHQRKQLLCADHGVHLLTIFEDEWLQKKSIVKSKITHQLKLSNDSVFARKCTIRPVSTSIRRKFLDKYHIQGDGCGSINYGLYHDAVLVGVINFIQRPGKVFELNRYATVVTVVGGFSKLLAHFKRTIDWDYIFTYANLRWSSGDVYIKNGFTMEKVTTPNFFYVDTANTKRITRQTFQKHKLSKILKAFNPKLTAESNAAINNWYRIYDCGHLRYGIHNI